MLHTHLLRACLLLYGDRRRQLDQTLQRLGHSDMPSDETEFRQVLTEVEKELAPIQPRNAPLGAHKYHHAPLRVALALFHAMIVRYRELSRSDAAYRDAALDDFCHNHSALVNDLKSMRHSVLHERPDNLNTQEKFVMTYNLNALYEGADIYNDYVKRLRWDLKKGGARA